MSYSPPSTKSKKLEVAIFQWSSGGSINSACPLTLINHNWDVAPVINGTGDGLTLPNWDVAPVINGTGDGLTLPNGCYRAMATVYATRTTTDDNIQFAFRLDGTVIGKAGQTDYYFNSGNVDQADCTFTVASSATLELIISMYESSIPTLSTNCRLVLWRSSI